MSNLEQTIKQLDANDLDTLLESLQSAAKEAKRNKQESNIQTAAALRAIAETMQEQRDISRALLVHLQSQEAPELPEYPTELDVTVTNPVTEVSVKKPSWFSLPSFDLSSILKALRETLSTKLVRGTPDTRQYVVLVDPDGRPLDLSKLFVPQPRAQTLGSVFRGGITLVTASSVDGTLTGTIDGVNTDFVLPSMPRSGSEHIYVAGARQTLTEDYTITGRTITFNLAPQAGPIVADYTKQ